MSFLETVEKARAFLERNGRRPGRSWNATGASRSALSSASSTSTMAPSTS